MDYNEIVDQIQSASLFDVYRLRCALDHILEDPERLAELRHSLIPGRDVTYFSWKDNRLVEVTILELKQTRVLVREKGSERPYTIPMFWVNLGDLDIDLKPRQTGTGLSRSELSVGDQVGFRDRQNIARYGEVIRLNPRTATLRVDGRYKWRVGYGFLFRVVDGQHAHRKLVIDVEAIDACTEDHECPGRLTSKSIE